MYPPLYLFMNREGMHISYYDTVRHSATSDKTLSELLKDVKMVKNQIT